MVGQNLWNIWMREALRIKGLIFFSFACCCLSDWRNQNFRKLNIGRNVYSFRCRPSRFRLFPPLAERLRHAKPNRGNHPTATTLSLCLHSLCSYSIFLTKTSLIMSYLFLVCHHSTFMYVYVIMLRLDSVAEITVLWSWTTTFCCFLLQWRNANKQRKYAHDSPPNLFYTHQAQCECV